MSTDYWQTNSQSLGESYLSADQLPQMLLEEEQDNPVPYFDSQEHASIGIGVNITVPGNMALVLQQLGVLTANQTVSQQQQLVDQFEQAIAGISQPGTLLNNTLLQTALNAQPQKIPGFGADTFSLSQPQAETVLASIVQGFSIVGVDGNSFSDTSKQAQLDAILNANGSPVPHDTREYMALMSLFYNSLHETGPDALIGPKLLAALAAGNRAEAWYEIRYDSNNGLSASPGIAKRRYYESQVFGLYGTYDQPTFEEATQAYQMLTAHRAAILQYENTYGGEINAANSDYHLTGTNQVETLANALLPAESVVLAQLKQQYSILGNLNPSDPTDIYLDPTGSTFSVSLNASCSSVLTNNVLVASQGGNGVLAPDQSNDTLIAGAGNDVLIAGAGNDLLQAGSGNDTLIGGFGNTTLAGGAGSDTFVDVAPLSALLSGTPGVETISDPTGTGSVWLETETGTTRLAGGKADSTTPYTWTDSAGNQYRFAPDPSGDPGAGTLTITSGTGGDIVIQDFNLNTAETNPNGELGIKFAEQTALSVGPSATADSFASGNYAPSSVTATTLAGAASQTLTVSLSAVSDTARQMTLNFSGTHTAAFAVDTGANLLPITNGAVTLTVPAGQDRLTVGLIATETLATNQTLDITASLPDTPAGASPAGNILQVNFAASTFSAPINLVAVPGHQTTNSTGRFSDILSVGGRLLAPRTASGPPAVSIVVASAVHP